MSLLLVAAADRRINEKDWGVPIILISPTGAKQDYDATNPGEILRPVMLRYSYTDVDADSGLTVIVDNPVVTLSYASIDQTALGGLPETIKDTSRWACIIPSQYSGDTATDPFIVYKVQRSGDLGDLVLYLRKSDEV